MNYEFRPRGEFGEFKFESWATRKRRLARETEEGPAILGGVAPASVHVRGAETRHGLHPPPPRLFVCLKVHAIKQSRNPSVLNEHNPVAAVDVYLFHTRTIRTCVCGGGGNVRSDSCGSKRRRTDGSGYEPRWAQLRGKAAPYRLARTAVWRPSSGP